MIWEIYRGDSFQLETTPEQALEASIYIKACIKQFRNIDVRIAIGLGEKTYTAQKITESNGEAFVNSGKSFEALMECSTYTCCNYSKKGQANGLPFLIVF